MLKRALPPAFLVLSACTTPDPTPPPRAEAPAQRAPDAPPAVIDRKPVPQVAEVDGATRALYLANCAQCHGEKGDGEGVTQLDRKARSFLDGGFSYGNTKEAILRSIAHGIPGTPMPSFEKALKSEQIAALTDYVIALGPERIVVDPSESEMVVRDRPLVVYGKLPPIVDGGSEIARGLAIGTPDGLTFEYRTDDVQLVGVRAGRFVNRTDWGGRGGTTLEMLGKPLWSENLLRNVTQIDLANTPPDGWTESLSPRTAALIATQVRADAVEVEYEIVAGSGDQARRARVTQTCRAFRNRAGSGFRIDARIACDQARTSALFSGFPAYSGFMGTTLGRSVTKAWLARDVGESRQAVAARWADRSKSMGKGASHQAVFDLSPNEIAHVEIYVITDLAPEFVSMEKIFDLYEVFE